MIRIHRPTAETLLNPKTRTALKKRGESAVKLPARDKRIQNFWKNFLRSKPRTEVDEKLKQVFWGKCAFCEQICAIDIDHFWPKSLFPDRLFEWNNFLLSCKNCNNFKQDHFPIDSGQPVFINPCEEEPLDILRWNFRTGAVSPHSDSWRTHRGEVTCRHLKLDSDPLRTERKKKLSRVLRALARVVNHDPVSEIVLEELKEEFDPHSPWLAIVRQLFLFPAQYRELVDRAQRKLPEIRTWIAAWL